MTSAADQAFSTRQPNYTVTETIYRGTRTTVYRAVEAATQRPLIIKVLSQPYPSFGELVQFRNQYTITKNLSFPGIVKPLGLETLNGFCALVMEDLGCTSLSTYLDQHPLNLAEILEIATQLTTILHRLHQAGIIHKDIKPANILIHPQSKEVRLIDFSIASLLPKETQIVQSPKCLEGSLPYLAPEQTGRMNRAIDYRADFYALGVTLYRLLTGQLPFTSDDPMELIHCHIAQVPPMADRINAGVTATVAQIVAKLMEKNAEDRYQSALGLKHDLEQCLEEWRSQNTIVNFELGTQDICDRFIIPEKLYGRDSEVQTLLDAFVRAAKGKSEMVLVEGFSGVGKTAVVNQVHKPIVEKRGYFIKGKFDQFNRDIPFSALIQAFRDLMGQLLGESDADLQAWKAKIFSAVGENGQVLVDVIPELERIIGAQPPAVELSGSAAQNRFNRIFERFIATFTTREHPLTIFIDDLQWADSASLNLLKVLMGKSRSQHLLLLGAFRDNEVYPAHPLMRTLRDLDNGRASISRVTLAPLSQRHINQLVADILNCGAEQARPLAELAYQKTEGNPFFTTQFLKGLYEDELIRFNQELGSWECDLKLVREAALTDDVVDFMMSRLRKLPPETQGILQFAACIGNRFDLKTLSIICRTTLEKAAQDLWLALQEGLVLPANDTYKLFQGDPTDLSSQPEAVDYYFLHDRVQQSAYSLIPDQQRQSTHLQIGRSLIQQHQSQDWEAETLFLCLTHLNQAVDLITAPQERRSLIELNLKACKKAKQETAYGAAQNYARQGIDLLPKDAWKMDYDLAIALHELAAEASYLSTDFETAQALSQTIISNVHILTDAITSYELLVQIYIAQDKQLEAIETGLSTLRQLGIPLFDRPDWQNHLPRLPRSQDLVSAPKMTDSGDLAALRILITITPPTHHVKPELFPTVVLTMVDLCERKGISQPTAYAYGIYGLLLDALVGDPDLGHRSGQLSLKILDQFPNSAYRTKVNMLFAVFVCAAKDPGRHTLPLLEQGIEAGLEIGDIEYVSYCIMAYVSHQLLLGVPLEDIGEFQAKYGPVLHHLKQEHCIEYAQIWCQGVDALAGIGEGSDALSDQSVSVKVKALQASHNQQCLFALHLRQLMLCYGRGDYAKAHDHALEASASQEAAFGILLTAAHNFYYSLTLLALCHDTSDLEAQSPLLKKVLANQNKLRQLASHSPENYQHKFDLVEAEKCRVKGEKLEAMEYYDRAIAGAKDNNYPQEKALANELAAQFYGEWGKSKIAITYMQDAYYGYSYWGAKAKTDQLEADSPDLLGAIVDKHRTGLDNLSSLTGTIISGHQSQRSGVSNSVSSVFDFAFILQAAQKLSSTIHLQELLEGVSQIILKVSGAQRLLLLTLDESRWQVRTSAEVSEREKIVAKTQPLVEQSLVPIRLIQYVKNTQAPVCIDEAETEMTGILAGYSPQPYPQSILCVPLINQGDLIAVAYLEHSTAKGCFSPDRQTLIKFLCAQAAVSWRNAELYGDAQQSRNRAEEALSDLKQAQLQLVQSEKMSALGNLIAGVAHEINNPVGFLEGNIQPAQDYVENLVGLIDLYQEKMPDPDAELEEMADEVDLDFIRTDFPQLLDSMQAGVNRIKSISNSLRNFSRKDQDHKMAFNIHDGIESTLLILKHRTKSNDQRSAIKIVKEYGNLPDIKCFPGQLNQVFMNILANAVDALDEACQYHDFERSNTNPCSIIIRTFVDDNHANVLISDNGMGIPEDIQSKIFDHLFTTKLVGKGTGLGLAIAQQIIVDNHGGNLTMDSNLGQGTSFCIVLPID